MTWSNEPYNLHYVGKHIDNVMKFVENSPELKLYVLNNKEYSTTHHKTDVEDVNYL